jgi:hypothetical protein
LAWVSAKASGANTANSPEANAEPYPDLQGQDRDKYYRFEGHAAVGNLFNGACAVKGLGVPNGI